MIHRLQQTFLQLETGISLDIVVWIQAHGNAFFDGLAQTLNIVGHPVTSATLISQAFWRVDRVVAYRTIGALSLALVAVMSIKQLFKTARPYVAHPNRIDALLLLNSYGLPSGHTTGAVIVVLILADWFKKRWVWMGGGLYIALIAWSRLYLGVHYPHDELAGLLLAPVVLMLSYWLEQQIAIWRSAARTTN